MLIRSSDCFHISQILASSGPIMATISAGMVVGYSAILIPELKKPHSQIKISSEHESWIGECIYHILGSFSRINEFVLFISICGSVANGGWMPSWRYSNGKIWTQDDDANFECAVRDGLGTDFE